VRRWCDAYARLVWRWCGGAGVALVWWRCVRVLLLWHRLIGQTLQGSFSAGWLAGIPDESSKTDGCIEAKFCK